MEKKEKCRQCVFRSRFPAYKCNFASLMGHTRKAVPPEKCAHFIAGKRLETPEEAKALLEKLAKKAARKERKKPDWSRGLELYRLGKNDGEIAVELSVSIGAVCGWRRRNGLPANAGARGKSVRKEQET